MVSQKQELRRYSEELSVERLLNTPPGPGGEATRPNPSLVGLC